MRKIVEGVWIEDGEPALLGITKDFVEESGDITYVNFVKNPGESFEKDEVIVSLETVKAVAEVRAPIAGKIVEVNKELESDPDKLNEDPEGIWLVKIDVAKEDLKKL